MRLTCDRDERTLSGMLLPFGEVGYTSAGRVIAERGAVVLPATCSHVKLFTVHGASDSPRDPVGVMTAAEETDDGIVAAFRIARSPAGDQLIRDVEDEVRDGLSVELDAIDIRAGKLRAGTLTAAVCVPIPAFATARLAAESSAVPAPLEGDAPVTETIAAAPDLAASHTPDPVPAPASMRAPATARPVSALTELTRRLSAAYRAHDGATLMAALADIVPGAPAAGNPGLTVQALGELWAGVAYESRYSSLILGGDLTGAEVRTFSWNPAPVVADYAGNKAEVPSNAAALVAGTTVPTRLAGAHDIDRIYRDLGDDAVLRSYWARMVESYKIQLDARALDEIRNADTSGATAVNLADALIRGTLAVSKVATPTFALVADDLIIEAAGLPSDTAPLGLTPSSMVSVTIPPITTFDATIAPRAVYVGARQACRQLTFDPPVRVEAVNVPNAGIDAGLYGYSAEITENPAAVWRCVVSALVP